MNEAETRAEHIDPALKAAGWGVVEGSRVGREYPIAPGRIEGHGKRGKALTADYVLEYRNRKLAVGEAKAWDEALTEGVAQAKNYAGKMAVRFAYVGNGQGIYAVDMETGKEGEIARYPTYVRVGVEELDQEKLTPLLLLKYHNSLADAVADLGGRPEEINKAFAGFQKYLYQQTAAA